MLLLLAAALAIPLGLDLYLPVPEGNPLTTEKIEVGRRLFFDRRFSRADARAQPPLENLTKSSQGAGRQQL